MTKVARHRLLTYAAACCAAAAMAAPVASLGQRGEALEEGLELVDPNVLRVCADPNNMPFSNEKGEGFENKIAELFAEKLGKRVAYTFYPQATGFVRMTLNSHRCDVIMGYPQGNEMVQNTNPYYQTAYAFVSKAGSPLETSPRAIWREPEQVNIPGSVWHRTRDTVRSAQRVYLRGSFDRVSPGTFTV